MGIHTVSLIIFVFIVLSLHFFHPLKPCSLLVPPRAESRPVGGRGAPSIAIFSSQLHGNVCNVLIPRILYSFVFLMQNDSTHTQVSLHENTTGLVIHNTQDIVYCQNITVSL